MGAKLHLNTVRRRGLEKLYKDAERYEYEAQDLRERASRMEEKAKAAILEAEEIERADPLPYASEKFGFLHRIQTVICPKCGRTGDGKHYDCPGAIPVPVVIYLPDVRDLLSPFHNKSVIPYQGGFQAVIRAGSVQAGDREDAVREFGPESNWMEPSRLPEDSDGS